MKLKKLREGLPLTSGRVISALDAEWMHLQERFMEQERIRSQGGEVCMGAWVGQ